MYAGDEPIGTLRIRWLEDFAKLEHTAFRQDYRSIHILKEFAFFAFDRVEEGADIGPELAELLDDTAKTYLQIAERISDRCHSRLPLED